jgi:hypothetical protein
MTTASDLPEIRFALPINSESRWSDLLAVLIATDPEPLARLLGFAASREQMRVEREVAVNSAERPDLILRVKGRPTAVFEVKVLAGLGPKQLERYRAAEPDADAYVVVHPERLVVDLQGASQWDGMTWERLLDAFAEGRHPWVSALATAWRAHLDATLPKVDSSTRWNDLTDGEGFVVAMRARASWVFSHLRPPVPVEHDLVSSAAGASAVVRMFAPAAAAGYRVIAEAEERLGVRSIPKFANAATRPPKGPSVKVALLQDGVSTSAGFDWDYLLAMWPVMQAARDDWVRTSARPRDAHDKAQHQSMVAKGGPKYLGIGFGERQARINHQCMFGARFQLAPDVTLGDVVRTLEQTAELLLDMAAVQPPERLPP